MLVITAVSTNGFSSLDAAIAEFRRSILRALNATVDDILFAVKNSTDGRLVQTLTPMTKAGMLAEAKAAANLDGLMAMLNMDLKPAFITVNITAASKPPEDYGAGVVDGNIFLAMTCIACAAVFTLFASASRRPASEGGVATAELEKVVVSQRSIWGLYRGPKLKM